MTCDKCMGIGWNPRQINNSGECVQEQCENCKGTGVMNSDTPKECPECNNIAKHRDGCRYGKLERELAALRKELEEATPTREQARVELGDVLRHSDGPHQASHGCVEVTRAIEVVDYYIARLALSESRNKVLEGALEKALNMPRNCLYEISNEELAIWDQPEPSSPRKEPHAHKQ